MIFVCICSVNLCKVERFEGVSLATLGRFYSKIGFARLACLASMALSI